LASISLSVTDSDWTFFIAVANPCSWTSSWWYLLLQILYHSFDPKLQNPFDILYLPCVLDHLWMIRKVLLLIKLMCLFQIEKSGEILRCVTKTIQSHPQACNIISIILAPPLSKGETM
jgi:hypothetical protein